jgi:hypothetical protein
MMTPKYTHDCDKCQFVARVSMQGTDSDWYVCPQDLLGATVIGRYSSEGSDYTSCPVDILDKASYAIAWRPATDDHVVSAERLISQGVLAMWRAKQ